MHCTMIKKIFHYAEQAVHNIPNMTPSSTFQFDLLLPLHADRHGPRLISRDIQMTVKSQQSHATH